MALRRFVDAPERRLGAVEQEILAGLSV